MKLELNGIMKRVVLLLLLVFLSLSTTFAQQSGSLPVRGSITDTKGESIIGASVIEKGTTNGAATDVDGNFILNVQSPQATLVVSFLGYKTQEIPLAGKTNLAVKLHEDSELLDEVVVIGYGSVKKSDATGSVVAIKVDEKNKGLSTSAQDLLGGKIAGVSVTSSGGRPGEGASIRIRGGSSLSASNDPLVIIDGVIMSNDLPGASNPLSSLNPADIETFTVLKDASATAIYGSRASNGVILITTKKGVSGALKVAYNGSLSVSTRRNSYDVLTGDEYRSFIAERFKYDSRKDIVMSKLGTANTDWQDEIFQTAISTDHNLSVYGSLGGAIPFRASLGYTNEEGILKTSNMERFTGSISLTPSLFDNHLKLNLNARGTFTQTRFADAGAIGAAISFDPTQPVKNGSMWGGYTSWTDSDGQLASIATKNPVAMLEMQNNRANVRNFTGNIQADYKLHFFPDLRLNLNLGLDVATTGGTDFKNPFNPTVYNQSATQSGSRKNFNNLKNDQLLEFYAQYQKDLENIKSRFDVMGGYSWQHYKRTSDEVSWYVSKEDQVSNLGLINPDYNAYKFKEYYLLSYFGRFNYTFDDKYLFTFTLRNDGSSRFNKDNRWGIFPSTALAWKMKEENFLKDVNVLSDLKLRLGWGKTGQQDLGDDYFYPSTPYYTTGNGQAMYPLGREENGTIKWVNQMRPTGYNPNLKWETTTTWNAGIDYGFLDNRINGAIDVYYRKTTDLLNTSAEVPAGTSVAERLPQNIGSLTNRGIEFSINARPIVKNDFQWIVNFNLAYNKSKITELVAFADEDYKGSLQGNTGGDGGQQPQIYQKGYAPLTFYVYEQVYDDNGKPLEGVYVDRNGDGIIDDDDRYYYKKPAADVTMGFSSKWNYKNWDFGFNGRVSLGNYVYNAMESNSAELALTSIYSNNIFLSNRPTSALYTDFQNKQVLSDYYVQNAAFLKIDNITLGYTFAKPLFKTETTLRVYGTVQNPIVITKYDGLDPEVFGGIDYNFYPRPLMFMFGVNLNF